MGFSIDYTRVTFGGFASGPPIASWSNISHHSGTITPDLARLWVRGSLASSWRVLDCWLGGANAEKQPATIRLPP
jgi:hypothetical protein